MAITVNYKIVYKNSNLTIIDEYWDDLHVKSYRVSQVYRGGDILDFIEQNSHYCIPYFDALEEFNRRHDILNF